MIFSSVSPLWAFQVEGIARSMQFFVDIDQTIGTGHIGSCLEESIAYYQRMGIHLPLVSSYMELFQYPEVMRIHDVIPGAVAGLEQLARIGTITYATVRDEQEITKEWLARHHFPCAENVLFCKSILHKVVILHRAPGNVILIDDRYKQIAAILVEGQERFQHLSHRMLLVGFGASEIACSCPAPSFALRSWYEVSSLIESLQIIGKDFERGNL